MLYSLCMLVWSVCMYIAMYVCACVYMQTLNAHVLLCMWRFKVYISIFDSSLFTGAQSLTNLESVSSSAYSPLSSFPKESSLCHWNYELIGRHHSWSVLHFFIATCFPTVILGSSSILLTKQNHQHLSCFQCKYFQIFNKHTIINLQHTCLSFLTNSLKEPRKCIQESNPINYIVVFVSL